MSRDIASITWRHSRAGARAWTTYFGTKQSWSNNCMMFMSLMKRAMTSKHGLFIAKAEDCQKCDIYATPNSTTISGDLTPQCKIFYNSRNRGGNGRIWLKCMNLFNKQSTAKNFKAVDGGRVVQFLAVFEHFSCETFLLHLFLRGRPKSPLIV
jgi:hypothetical protein